MCAVCFRRGAGECRRGESMFVDIAQRNDFDRRPESSEQIDFATSRSHQSDAERFIVGSRRPVNTPARNGEAGCMTGAVDKNRVSSYHFPKMKFQQGSDQFLK